MSTNSSNTTTSSGYNWQSYSRFSEYSIGILFNIINVAVFLNPRLKEVSYKLMLTKTIVNITYLLMALLTEVISICNNCIWSRTYFSAAINVAFLQNIMPFLAMFRIFLNITISVYTYCILINRPWKGKYTHVWIQLVLAVLSVIYYFNKPFVYYISDSFRSMSGQTDFGKSDANNIISIVQTFGRVFLAVVVVGSINVMSSIKFRARYKNRVFTINDKSIMTNQADNQSLEDNQTFPMSNVGTTAGTETNGKSKGKNKQNSQRVFNIVSMVIASSFAIVFGEIPYAFVTIVSALKYTSSIPNYSTVNAIALLTLFLAPAFDIFIYYCFNKLYRKVLNGYCMRIFKFFFFCF